MVAPTFLRVQLSLAIALAMTQPAKAQELSNRAFQIKYGASGITSLKRTGDVADTDYIAAGGAFGRLLVRYRTARNGDWKELREVVPAGSSATSAQFRLAALPPGL